MARGRNSTATGLRLPDSVYTMVKKRADRRKMSVNEFLNRVIANEVLRKR